MAQGKAAARSRAMERGWSRPTSWESSPELDPGSPSALEAGRGSPCPRSMALFVNNRLKIPPAGCGSVTAAAPG